MATAVEARIARRQDTAGQGTLEVLCRGLVGYLSYLATCKMSAVYSEYLLYEPILRIGRAQGYTVKAERPVDRRKLESQFGWPSLRRNSGDVPRIDFEFERQSGPYAHFGLEVKWVKSCSHDVRRDLDKLMAFAGDRGCGGYLLIFGKLRDVGGFSVSAAPRLNLQSNITAWKNPRTEYAARWYRVF